MDAVRPGETDAVSETANTPELNPRGQFLDEKHASDSSLPVEADHHLSACLPRCMTSTSDYSLPPDMPATTSNLIDSIAVEAVTLPPASTNTREFHAFGSQQGTIPIDVIDPSGEKLAGDKHIDQYCDDLCLDVPSRLKLFIQVCAAIHSVHQHAVIHGNLKPGTIIVTVEGITKVLHVGTGTLVQPASCDDDGGVTTNLAQTRAGESPLTPEYLSPEQVKGESVTTASDVYALGVVLYHLLTGRWSYRVKSGEISELFQAICEQLPEKPSNAVSAWPGEGVKARAGDTPALCLPTPDQLALARGASPRKLKRMLRGDLDSIVSMALQKEPERRYPSVAHLAEDVTRYLQRMPVQARRYFPAYRSSKFIRRHGIAVAAGFLFLLVFLTASSALTRAVMTLRRERAHTKEAFRQARQLLDQTLARITDDRLLSQPAFLPLRQALLQDAQGFYENYLQQQLTDPQLRAGQATAQTSIAKITSLTGSRTDAIAAYYQAIALWEKLVPKEPKNLESQAKLAQTLNELGLILLPLTDRLPETLNTFLRAQELNEQLVVAQPESPFHQLQLGVSLLNIAEIKERQGGTDEAIDLIEHVLKIDERLVTEHPDLLEPRIALATAFAAFGRLWAQDPAELPTAIASYEHAIELHEALTRQHPQLIDQSYLLATELSKLSGLQEELGLPEPALRSSSPLAADLRAHCHLLSRGSAIPGGLGGNL